MAHSSRGIESSVKGLFTEMWAGLRDTRKGCETPVNSVEPLLPLGLGDQGRMLTEWRDLYLQERTVQQKQWTSQEPSVDFQSAGWELGGRKILSPLSSLALLIPLGKPSGKLGRYSL